MNVLDDIRKYNTTEVGTKFISPSEQGFAFFPVAEDGKTQASPTSEFEILRGDLAKILGENVMGQGREKIEWRFGVVIEEVIRNDDEGVEVKLSTGERQSYDILVAADGQWSRVRKACFERDDLTVVDKNMYVAYFTIPKVESDDAWWRVYMSLQSRLVSLRPDSHGTIRAMLSKMPLNEEEKVEWEAASRGKRDVQEKLLHRTFNDVGWEAKRCLKEMSNTEDFYFQAVQQVRMKRWSVGRVVCLGDTAYAPTPLTGAGTSLAIIGAYVLAGEISRLREGQSPRDAFQAFEKEFRGHVESEQDIPSFVPGIMHPGTPLKRWMIQSVISTVNWVVTTRLFKRLVMGDGGGSSEELYKQDFPLTRYEAFEDAVKA